MLIKHFTEVVATGVAAAHVGDPIGELLVWLQLALRREASVGEIYALSNLSERLGDVEAPAEVVGLVSTAISNIWAQERAHATYLDSVLAAVARPPTWLRRMNAHLEGVMGAIEGRVMSGRTSRSPIGRATAGLMLMVGRRIREIPDFVISLAAMSFRDFCRFNADLEITAVHGYDRMLTLLCDPAAATSLGTGSTLAIDIARMRRDERYHNDVFLAVADWFDSPGGNTLRRELSLETCAAHLAEIRQSVYGADV